MASAAVPVASPKPTERPATMSVVLPYYKKIREFRRVFPVNASWLEREDVEVILALDEPSEEVEVVEVVKSFPKVRTKVLVNDVDHPWRVPSRAINVGVKSASGDLILVMSPETAFVGDVPSQVMEACKTVPGGTVVGQLAFASFQEVAELNTIFHGNRNAGKPLFFGIACFPKPVLYDVRGYDESFQGWGGDDIDVRNRVQLAGHSLYADEDIRVIHISERPRENMRSGRTADREQLRRAACPTTPYANPNGWGESFSRVSWDWRGLQPL